MDHLILNDDDVSTLLLIIDSHSSKWREIGTALGFTQPELNNIASKPLSISGAPLSYLGDLLSQWVQWPTENHKSKPTLKQLCSALKCSLVGLGSLAEKVEKELLQELTGPVILKDCSRYLRNQKQWQLHEDDFFELHIQKKSQSLEDYQTLCIGDLCKEIQENKHKMIFILGEPGSGKTTFAHQLWQTWKDGDTLDQYVCVILVHLRRPRIQEATTVSELLPYGDKVEADRVADAMIECAGRNILWILDGWDELTAKSAVQDSIIRKMVTQESPLPQSTIIITICTCILSLKELHVDATLHISLTGFTEQGLVAFLNKMLLDRKSTTSADDLLQQIRSKPSIDSICHLPLYAQMIIESVINSKDKRLTSCTKYGLLVPFILNLIKQQLDTSVGTLPIRETEFKELCHSAYETLKEKTLIFEQGNLLRNSYGLLSNITSLMPGEGEMKLYEFKHLSIQEYLAAMHCHINNDENNENDIKLLIDLYQINHPGFRTMVQMYSSITELGSKNDDQLLAQMVKLVERVENMEKRMSILISILHCLHEAQNPNKCVQVAALFKDGIKIERTYLHQPDCIALAYFLQSMDLSKRDDVFTVALSYVTLGDRGFDSLIQVLKQSGHDKRNPLQFMKGAIALRLNHTLFSVNQQSGEGLKELLLERQLLMKLHINGCPTLSDSGTRYIAEGLRYNEEYTNTLQELHLEHCSITDNGVEQLSLALQRNETLHVLNLRYNKEIGDKSLMHLGKVLEYNTTLKELNLLTCLNITDLGLSQLACSLASNRSLVKLHIGDHCHRSKIEGITERGLLVLFMMLSMRKNRPKECFELYLSHDLHIVCEEATLDENDPAYCYTIYISYYAKGSNVNLIEGVVNQFVISTKPRIIHICNHE